MNDTGTHLADRTADRNAARNTDRIADHIADHIAVGTPVDTEAGTAVPVPLTRDEQSALERLDPSVPVVSFARQGDVIVVPRPHAAAHLLHELTPVPPEGVAVVRGENGANTHLLVADGDVRFLAVVPGVNAFMSELRVGELVVADGATAYLIHPEHGAIGFRPGAYTLSRQREFDGSRERYVFD